MMRVYNDDDLTQEELNSLYLQENPDIEYSLWTEWVFVVCEREKIPTPSPEELKVLVKKFYHGKAPIDSVFELKEIRIKSMSNKGEKE
jgi:hypothetical protein